MADSSLTEIFPARSILQIADPRVWMTDLRGVC
jgi:hypothetical protein